MVLPILVPPIDWLMDLGRPAPIEPVGRSGKGRRPFPTRGAKQARQRKRPPTHRRIGFGRDADARKLQFQKASPARRTARELLFDCEVLVKALLRRSRRLIGPNATRTVRRISRTFEPRQSTVMVMASDNTALSWMTSAMLWQGMTHPLSLLEPTQHPPTAVVRWLAQFSVEQQVDCAREILDLLARRFVQTSKRCDRQTKDALAHATRPARRSRRALPVCIVLKPG